jgi:hypothetical protein
MVTEVSLLPGFASGFAGVFGGVDALRGVDVVVEEVDCHATAG